MGRGRKTSFFIYLEIQYAKTDYKNEIYAKNWIRRTWTKKVNGQSQRSGQRPGQRWRPLTGEWCQQMTWRWWRHLGLMSVGEHLARAGAWESLTARGGAWASVQNLLAARDGTWELRWWLGFHERVDRWRKILVVPAKTQSEQGSRRRWSGSGLETLNDGGCRSGTRDDDWNASEV